MENGNKPISPFTPSIPKNQEDANGYSGLTKREYFAGLAMQGLLSSYDGSPILNITLISELSIKSADSLLEQLEKQ